MNKYQRVKARQKKIRRMLISNTETMIGLATMFDLLNACTIAAIDANERFKQFADEKISADG